MTSLALKMGSEGEGGGSLEFDELANKKCRDFSKMTFLGNFCGIFGMAHKEISESEGLMRTTRLLTWLYDC